jgi:predicted RNA-binding protein with PUA-like domain
LSPEPVVGVHDADGAVGAPVEVLVRVRDRQVLLQPGEPLLVAGEGGGLLRQVHGDERLEGGLVAEELVLVGLVGADGHLHRRVEVHPGDVARVVVVALEGVGPQGEELLERGVVGEGRGLAQEIRGGLQPLGVLARVGDGGQAAVRAAADDRHGRGELVLVGRMLGHPAVEGLLGEVLGVVAGPFGTHLVADERLALRQPVPGAEVDGEVLAGGRGVRAGVALELLAHRGIAGPGLTQEDLVHQLGGLDELVEHLAVPGAEVRQVGVERGRGELRDALLDVRHDPWLLPRGLRGGFLLRGPRGRREGQGAEPGQADQRAAHSFSFRWVPFAASPRRMAHRSHHGQAGPPRSRGAADPREGPIMAERVKPEQVAANYWLLSTDPEEYSFSDLERDTETVWDGVTEYSSLKSLRDVEPGEEAFIFHAGTELAIVGIARFTSDTYPAPRGASADEVAVDLAPVRRLERPVALAEIEDLPELQDFDLVNDPDLEVLEVTPEIWSRVLELSQAALAYSTQEDQE